MNHLKTGNTYFAQGSYKSYKFNGVELQETGMYAMDWRNYLADIARFSGIDALSESYLDFSPYHFAMNNPVSFADPTGMYSTDHNGNYSTTNTDEIRKLQGYFGSGGSVDGVGDLISNDETFKKDIPELVINVSKWHYAFTGDYLTNGDKKTIFDHLDKYIGSMSTINQWDGDKGFWGNWGSSDNFFGKLSYGLANNTYLGFQVIDTFNWLGAKRISGITGEQVYSNLDNTTQFDSGERGFAFTSTFNPLSSELKVLGVGQPVLPKIAFRLSDDLAPLSASQFSKLFKGTAIARVTPATRGLLNRNMNTGLNMVNNIGMFKMGYTSIIKPFSPNKKDEK
ncbi:RHS repeat-associated core domain-containing protein [Chryseobacterium taichungense]|uniref:RHS repeat-associated core domain-containing protein n=1 Tax=Chryseobacterium taichungense TaxID=295069 RepID=A0A1H8DXL3_9FLAO|nr:RHS repeat-associated core domain-containing protein [Chryseobacterium taichungense]